MRLTIDRQPSPSSSRLDHRSTSAVHVSSYAMTVSGSPAFAYLLIANWCESHESNFLRKQAKKK